VCRSYSFFHSRWNYLWTWWSFRYMSNTSAADFIFSGLTRHMLDICIEIREPHFNATHSPHKNSRRRWLIWNDLYLCFCCSWYESPSIVVTLSCSEVYDEKIQYKACRHVVNIKAQPLPVNLMCCSRISIIKEVLFLSQAYQASFIFWNGCRTIFPGNRKKSLQLSHTDLWGKQLLAYLKLGAVRLWW
jgi:hypothetical protein